MTTLILTLVGPDRPGLVSGLSETVAACGGSWNESRMARLAGRFAGIVLLSLPDQGADGLHRQLAALRDEGFQVVLQDAAAEAAAPGGTVLTLGLVGNDRPGIVRDITSILARRGVNIEELTTNVLSGSFSGEAMFRAEARLRVPDGVTVAAIRQDIETLGNELMVDLSPATAP